MYEKLKHDIISGKYLPGDRIPSEKDLSEAFDVSRITSKKSLEKLAAEGLISRHAGRGSFVSEKIQSDTPTVKEEKQIGQTLIGLVMTDFADSFGRELILGIEREAEDACFIVLRRSFGIPDQEQKAIKALVNLGVDGLIILPAQAEYFSAEILKLVVEQFPLVLVDRHLKGVAAASISTDNVEAARLGTTYLLDLNHKNIALLSPPPMDTTAIEDRIEGFIRVHAEQGVAVDKMLMMNEITCTLPNSFTEANIAKDVEKIKRHLQQHPEITAVFALEYNIALLAYEAAKQIGYSVPEDLSILCFDYPSVQPGQFKFTHLIQDQLGIGKKAVELILKLKNGESIPNQTMLSATLVEGESTGHCRRM